MVGQRTKSCVDASFFRVLSYSADVKTATADIVQLKSKGDSAWQAGILLWHTKSIQCGVQLGLLHASLSQHQFTVALTARAWFGVNQTHHLQQIACSRELNKDPGPKTTTEAGPSRFLNMFNQNPYCNLCLCLLKLFGVEYLPLKHIMHVRHEPRSLLSIL